MVELADTRDLDNLSTWVGNSHVNRVKFGGTPFGTIPSEASIEERVETRRRAPKLDEIVRKRLIER